MDLAMTPIAAMNDAWMLDFSRVALP